MRFFARCSHFHILFACKIPIKKVHLQTYLYVPKEYLKREQNRHTCTRYSFIIMYFVSLQDILKKCEQNVSDHRNYLEKQSDCAQWLIKAKEKFDANADTIGSRSELEEKLEQIQVNTA